jgi:hypothetical protein
LSATYISRYIAADESQMTRSKEMETREEMNSVLSPVVAILIPGH